MFHGPVLIIAHQVRADMGSAFYPLELRVDHTLWPMFSKRSTHPSFEPWKAKVFSRDMHTCQFCGFQSSRYMDVINLDMNYRNNKMSNLATACPFCSQCFFIEMIGKLDFGGGTVIHLPQMTQNHLNALCHVLFCAMANATDYSMEAQNIYNLLRIRGNLVEDHVGKGLSDPSMLAQMLIDTPMNNRSSVEQELFKELRILPSRKKFNKQIEQWAKMALSEPA